MKLFAFDLDNTILNSKRKISITNLEVIDEMISKGIILIPATGRSLKGIPNELLDRDIRYVIVSNGAKVIDLFNDKIIWKSYLSEKELIPLIKHLNKKRLLFSIHSENDCFDSNLLQILIRKILYNNTSKLLIRFDKILKLGAIYKIQLTFFSKKKLMKVYNLISGIQSIHVVKSSKHCLEITNKSATKGNALRNICDYLKIERNEVVSIGDNDNDIEMLLFSGTSYAVQNSSENAKNMVDFIVSSNDNNPLTDIALD